MKPRTLSPAQIEACCKTMPGFARSYADVIRRDAEVAANRAAMQKGNCSETGAEAAALSPRPPLRLRLAAKTAPDNRGERA